jgi:hypothetical protein
MSRFNAKVRCDYYPKPGFRECLIVCKCMKRLAPQDGHRS